jgi:hypothetical protein
MHNRLAAELDRRGSWGVRWGFVLRETIGSGVVMEASSHTHTHTRTHPGIWCYLHNILADARAIGAPRALRRDTNRRPVAWISRHDSNRARNARGALALSRDELAQRSMRLHASPFVEYATSCITLCVAYRVRTGPASDGCVLAIIYMRRVILMPSVVSSSTHPSSQTFLLRCMPQASTPLAPYL